VDGQPLPGDKEFDLEFGAVRAEPGREESDEKRADEPHGARP
jgi:hypothetical protein